MCDEECGSIIEDILVGFGIFFLVVGFFKLIFLALEALFVLLSFLFNCLLWVFHKVGALTDKEGQPTEHHELSSFDGRAPYAHGLTALVMIVGGLFLFMGNDASNVSANDADRVRHEAVQTKPSKSPMFEARVIATKLNARNEPHANSKVLFKLNRNQIVNVYMKQRGWWLVEANGVKAWSSAKYLVVH